MRTNPHYHHFGVAIVLALAGCLLSGMVPTTSWADDGSAPTNTVAGMDQRRPSRLDFEIGYFTARRQMFRELYGSFLNYAVSYQRPIAGRFDLSLRAEFIRLAENGPALKYWVGSLTPMLFYPLPRQAGLQPVIGAGLGLSHRRVIVTAVAVDAFGEPYGEITATQKAWEVCAVATFGLDVDVSERLVLGAHTYFDYFPSGDPTVGDFGDTGGFHFVGRLGFKL